MRQTARILTICALWMGFTTPALTAEQLVTITVKAGVTQPFVQQVSAALRTPIAKQIDAQTYQLRIPALRTANDYADLYASLGWIAKTNPAPIYQVADHVQPRAYNVQTIPSGTPQKSTDYMPGEVLVKFKPGTTPEDIKFLNSHHNIRQLSVISGVNVHRLGLPQDMSVEDAVALYNASGIVEYAEPNFRMTIPKPVNGQAAPTPSASPSGGPLDGTTVVTEIPLDGGNQIRVHFRPDTPPEAIALFHQIFGTQLVEKESFYTYRFQLPMTMNPNRAARVIKLYPHVIDAQRLYS